MDFESETDIFEGKKFKVVVVGNPKVGKTKLIEAYMGDEYKAAPGQLSYIKKVKVVRYDHF